MTQYYVYRFCSPSRSTFMTGRYPWHIGQQTRMNLNPTPGIACGIRYGFPRRPVSPTPRLPVSPTPSLSFTLTLTRAHARTRARGHALPQSHSHPQ